MKTIEELERQIDQKFKQVDQKIKDTQLLAIGMGVASYAAAYFTFKEPDKKDDKKQVAEEQPKQYVYHRRYR